MGYRYLLVVDEDLDKLGIPKPDAAQVQEAWATQGGEGAPPSELTPHIVSALRKQFLADHRSDYLRDLDGARRWAHDNLGFRHLLQSMEIESQLAEMGRGSLHQRFYSEDRDAWFEASDALDTIAALERSVGQLPANVEAELEAFKRAMGNLHRYGLRFRFEIGG